MFLNSKISQNHPFFQQQRRKIITRKKLILQIKDAQSFKFHCLSNKNTTLFFSLKLYVVWSTTCRCKDTRNAYKFHRAFSFIAYYNFMENNLAYFTTAQAFHVHYKSRKILLGINYSGSDVLVMNMKCVPKKTISTYLSFPYLYKTHKEK